MKILQVIILCGVFVFSVEGAKILGIFQVPTRSHHNIGSSILKGLAAKGHDVTILSPFPSEEKLPNYNDVYLDGVAETGKAFRESWFKMADSNVLDWFLQISNFTNNLSDSTMRSKALQNIMKTHKKFDVIIIEPFGNDAFFGLGNYFNAHVVVMNTANSLFVNHLSGNVAPYSFVPNAMVTLSDSMTFFQRCQNTFAGIVFNLYQDIFILPTQRKLYEEFFPNAPDFDDAIKNASLFLINSHVILETPRPYLPNMISVGGIHVKEPKKLPQDLQSYLDDAKEGVIFFSLGSNMMSKDIPLHKREAFIKTLAKLPQKVLWKFEDENLPGKPSNVKIGKWFPQNDILAHPNVKLFITHAGLLSTTEAIYRGVPVLGIPFYGDQHANTAKCIAAGYGQGIKYEDLTEEKFTAAIKEVLGNPKYRENIQRNSAILKDVPMKPLDKAVFWVEHIIRHNGGRHLRSSSVDLSLSQYLLLDIIGFAAIVAGTFIVGIYLVIKTICCSRKTKAAQEGKNKKAKTKRE